MTINLKIESDLHVDWKENFDYMPGLDNIDIYIIAGDLGQLKASLKWLKKVIDKYPDVYIVHVFGNHSYYDSNIENVNRKMQEFSDKYNNLHHLENNSVVINGIRFIGACLWTTLKNSDPIEINDARSSMNDYNYIRVYNGEIRFTPHHSIAICKKSKEYIFNALKDNINNIPTIVVTHHKPYASGTRFMSSAYEEELRNDIGKLELGDDKLPIMFIHGHTHISSLNNLYCGDIEVAFISNQKGYPFENTGFNKNFVISLDLNLDFKD